MTSTAFQQNIDQNGNIFITPMAIFRATYFASILIQKLETGNEGDKTHISS